MANIEEITDSLAPELLSRDYSDRQSKQDNESHTNDTGFGRSESGESIHSSLESIASTSDSYSDDESSISFTDDEDISYSDDDNDNMISDDDTCENVFNDLRFSAINQSSRSSRSLGYLPPNLSNQDLGGTVRSVTSVQSAAPQLQTLFHQQEHGDAQFLSKKRLEVDDIQDGKLQEQTETLEKNDRKSSSSSTSILQSIGNFFRRKSSVQPPEVPIEPISPGEKTVFKDGDRAAEWSFETQSTTDAVQEFIELRRKEFQRSKRASHRRQHRSKEKEDEKDAMPERRQSFSFDHLGFASSGTDFSSQHRSKSMFALNTVGAACNTHRKILPLSPMSDVSSVRRMSLNSSSFDTSSIYTNDDAISRTFSQYSTITDIKDPSLHVKFELRDSSKAQCHAWKTQFSGRRSVKIRCQYYFNEMTHDAIVVPGNSFGFLDGEPEIQYTNVFGWSLQEKIQEIITEKYDGELLVGQAVIIKLEGEELEDIPEIFSHKKQTNPHHKYFIYVPVMRVPLQVQDSVNAYLSFRAVIRAVRKHNKSSDRNSFISSVLCPALCDGFGRMPCKRIALQMKTAYDALVLETEPEMKQPTNMGAMATAHVNMTSNKTGNWC